MRKRTPDQRIEKLSYTKFEEEFGFKPSSKLEQRFFALKGKQPKESLLRGMEILEAHKAALEAVREA